MTTGGEQAAPPMLAPPRPAIADGEPNMEQKIANVCAALGIDRSHLNRHIVRDAMRIPHEPTGDRFASSWERENYALRGEVADLKARLRKVEHRVCLLRRRHRALAARREWAENAAAEWAENAAAEWAKQANAAAGRAIAQQAIEAQRSRLYDLLATVLTGDLLAFVQSAITRQDGPEEPRL